MPAPARGDWLIDQLPLAMVADPFLAGFVHIFQDLADTFLAQIDGLEHVIDPTVAPPEMVQEMGRWLGAPQIHQTMPIRNQRQTVRQYGDGLGQRGTTMGLRQLVEMITDEAVSIEESGGVFSPGEEVPFNPRHVVITVDDTGKVRSSDEADLLERVRDELPADVTFELSVGERRLWPRVVVSPPAPPAPPAVPLAVPVLPEDDGWTSTGETLAGAVEPDDAVDAFEGMASSLPSPDGFYWSGPMLGDDGEDDPAAPPDDPGPVTS